MVLDLFSRQVVGWSMKSQMISDLAIDALLMAVWRRKPKREVMVQSDQGSQYRSSDWRSLLKANTLAGSMSRRGNCHDNAVAEIFPDAQTGTNQEKNLHHSARCSWGCIRLHRDVLQPNTTQNDVMVSTISCHR
jgi:transposase InsO family protein